MILVSNPLSATHKIILNIPGSIFPKLGRSPGEGNGYPLQYSYLENSMDRRVYSPWGHKELDTAEWLSLCYHILEEQPERSSPGLQDIPGVILNKMWTQ